MGLAMKYFLRFKLTRQKRLGADRVAAVDLEDDQMRISWHEIQRLTDDFSHVIGYGGFSTVYLARDHFRDSSTAAVKMHCSTTKFLYQAFRQELDILRTLCHDNIVKLLGYCDDREEGALILEYIPNGTLQEKLHGSNTFLPWKKRISIAFQIAQAIEYLHENPTLQIIHGDIKPSNILLDQNLNCKLCDFGSAEKINTFPSNSRLTCRNKATILGSPGYTDPLYLKTGLASKKNDVYSFGVIVLELITGVEAFSAESGERLTIRAEPMLRDAENVGQMVDLRLRGEVDLEEARAMAALAAICVCESPSIRPSASDIVNIMRSRISFL